MRKFFNDVANQLTLQRISFVATAEQSVPGDIEDRYADFTGNLSEYRRIEFLLGRSCAETALKTLGATDPFVEQDHRGAPIWPESYCGSISHTRGACCAAAAKKQHFSSLGLDIESANRKIAATAQNYFATESESFWLADAAIDESEKAFRMIQLFSAKESILKAHYGLFNRLLALEQISCPALPRNGNLTLAAGQASFALLCFSSADWVITLAAALS